MSLITLSNLKKSFGDRNLFDNVSFVLEERERAALIGPNGCGKTTLLKIVADTIPYDSGGITRRSGISIGYLAQDVDIKEDAGLLQVVLAITPEIGQCAREMAELERLIADQGSRATGELGTRYSDLSHLFDTLGGYELETRARATLLGLGFEEMDMGRSLETFSGGQKVRAALARLLLQSPDVVLLDEPTNHLDIHGCDWLQEHLLTRYQGAALIVSHDRYFLDRVVSRVIEMDNQTSTIYPGNYSDYAAQKTEAIEEQKQIYKRQQKEIARIEESIQTLFSHRKFSRRDSKLKQLERIQRVATTRGSATLKAGFGAAARSGREVVRLDGVSKSFPGKTLLSGVDHVFERGRKVGIVGPNGSGKTTLLRVITGEQPQDSGEVIIGHNVKMVYFAQQFEFQSEDNAVLEELVSEVDIASQKARDLLAAFLFMGNDAFKPVHMLSGGERCRLALAKVIAEQPNLLLLDEPTNHLDIASREALENALREFNGTIITASHDRYLLDRITDEIVEIKDGSFTRYIGNYSAYKDKTTPQLEPDSSNKAKTSNNKPEDQFRPFTPLREMERRIRDLTKRQAQLEADIHSMEERLLFLTQELGKQETYKDGTSRELSVEFEQLTKRVEGLYAEWETVCSELAQE